MFRGLRRLFSTFLLFILAGCQVIQPAIYPSDVFYINDPDSILLNSTKWSIYETGTTLYDDSMQFLDVADNTTGAQVVVLTHLGATNDFDNTQLFNDWGIGKNDMRLLFIFFFSQVDGEYVYQSMLFEIGARMASYLSAMHIDSLVETYFNDSTINASDYDQRIISLYFATVIEVYANVYQHTSFNHELEMDNYRLIQFDYIAPISSTPNAPLLNLPTWAWIVIIILVILLSGSGLLGGILSVFFHRGGGGPHITGGGGRSRGYFARK